VADITRGVLDGHVILSRDIAERGRFPAVDTARSVSRSLPAAASDAENALLAQTRRIVATYEKAEPMIRTGLYAAGSDPEIDTAITIWPALDAFFASAETGGTTASFARLAAILDPLRSEAVLDAGVASVARADPAGRSDPPDPPLA